MRADFFHCLACGLHEPISSEYAEDWEAWVAHRAVCPVINRKKRVGLCRFGRVAA